MTKQEIELRALLDRELKGQSFEKCDLIAHELTHDGEGWSTNDCWRIGVVCNDGDIGLARYRVIEHVVGRYDVFLLNYMEGDESSHFTVEGDEKTMYVECNGKTVAELRFDHE